MYLEGTYMLCYCGRKIAAWKVSPKFSSFDFGKKFKFLDRIVSKTKCYIWRHIKFGGFGGFWKSIQPKMAISVNEIYLPKIYLWSPLLNYATFVFGPTRNILLHAVPFMSILLHHLGTI